MQSYVFQVALVEADDGRWSAWVEALPGCATWGYTQEEALHNIHDTVEMYRRDMQKCGEEIPQAAALQTFTAPVVAITL